MKSTSETFTSYLNINASSIGEWRNSFHDSSMSVVQINSFLIPEVVNSVSHFLLTEAEFEDVYGLRNVGSPIVNLQAWEAASESERFFHFEQFHNKGNANLTQGFVRFMRLQNFLKSSGYFKFVSDITGLAICSTTNTATQRLRYGHYLKPHDDRGDARRIAFILYLTPDWKSEFGGQLSITSHDNKIMRLEPTFNSLVLFDVNQHKTHHIEGLTPQSLGAARMTMGGWLTL